MNYRDDDAPATCPIDGKCHGDCAHTYDDLIEWLEWNS